MAAEPVPPPSLKRTLAQAQIDVESLAILSDASRKRARLSPEDILPAPTKNLSPTITPARDGPEPDPLDKKIKPSYELWYDAKTAAYFADVVEEALGMKLSLALPLVHKIFIISTDRLGFRDYRWEEDAKEKQKLRIVFDVRGRYRGVNIVEDNGEDSAPQPTELFGLL